MGLPKRLTEMQKRFAELLVFGDETGPLTQTEAAIKAGYSEKTAKQKGYELKNILREQINDPTQKVLADKIPSSLHFLSELAEKAESESVRLGAIKDLLDRAGLKPVERIEQTNIEHMSNEEIQRELDALLKH